MSRIRITYELLPPEGLSPEAYAREIAVEQTVEVPEACITPELERRAVGRVEAVADAGPGAARAEISYPADVVSGDVPQLFSLVYGNVSLKPGVRVVDVDLPGELLGALPGPGFGVDGLRKLTGVAGGPILFAPVKPLGLTTDELARRARLLAEAGVDVIKDDHGLVDQPWAPFRERVGRIQEAVTETNHRTGGSTAYLPNVTAAPGALEERLDSARELGCSGVLVSPIPAGPGALASAARRKMAVLAHLTMTGTFFQEGAGIAPGVLYGTLFRAAGSDAVIHPNPGSRLAISKEACLDIQRRLRSPWGDLPSALPVAGGGLTAESVPRWTEVYGPDTGFLVGGGILAQPDLKKAAERLVGSVRAFR